ncbi:MAG TPA: GNAT family N-acetyltransferase [Rhodocyclaceae bacterium]|nr:GNAT family N-acetyltransferase [Rhodocyclaceae bacterium]HNH99574.1 GNAT family N-acetyltransferase [Rhodocyclaceae bacterium]
MRPVTISRAHANDMAAMLALLRELFEIERDFEFDADKQARGLAMLLQSPSATALVARESHAVIGMTSVQLVISTAEGAHSAWIEDVCVAGTARRRGVGRLLVEAALDWARSRGATRALLLADLDNAPALAFYARLGWQGTRLGAKRIFLCR